MDKQTSDTNAPRDNARRVAHSDTHNATGDMTANVMPLRARHASCEQPVAGREVQLLRCLRLFLGYLWALTLALAGAWLWLHRDELAQMLGPGDQAAVLAAACLCLAGAQFVFMLLVADDLCPRASKELTIFLKTFSGSIIWISLFWLVTIGWNWLV